MNLKEQFNIRKKEDYQLILEMIPRRIMELLDEIDNLRKRYKETKEAYHNIINEEQTRIANKLK